MPSGASSLHAAVLLYWNLQRNQRVTKAGSESLARPRSKQSAWRQMSQTEIHDTEKIWYIQFGALVRSTSSARVWLSNGQQSKATVKSTPLQANAMEPDEARKEVQRQLKLKQHRCRRTPGPKLPASFA